jgi:DNA mismatch repair protein MutL
MDNIDKEEVDLPLGDGDLPADDGHPMIKVLPQTLINQIAAGEVVVRMANVVKELVDNSLDAGAVHVEVHLRNDVRDVEIRDDGIGMNRDDAELCLQRHATSKIRTVDDLFSLHTRGFRGEALPSIASVSRLEIQTRDRKAEVGSRVDVEGGRIQRIESCGCPPGTRITIRDLFYNTPARLKFLKSSVAEANAVMVTVLRLALAQPGVGFVVTKDDRAILELPPRQALADRFAHLLGSAITREVLPVEFDRDGVRVHGVMGHPLDARHDRRSQYFFVNDRPFSSRQVTAALEQACKGFVMIGRFPAGAWFIELPPEEVDFNVHPTKEEVRFRDERHIAGTLYHAVQRALTGSPAHIGEMKLPAPATDESSSARPTESAPAAVPQATTEQPARPPAFFTSPEELVRRAFDRKQTRQEDFLIRPSEPAPSAAYPAPPPASPRSKPLHRPNGELISAGPGERPDDSVWSLLLDPEPLGQLAQTYIIARYGDELLLIDQHASHERLVYLDLKRKKTTIEAQPLLLPITMDLTPAQGETMQDVAPHLATLGFQVEEYGPRTWAITAIPTDLPEFDPVPLLMEALNDAAEARGTNAIEELRDRILIRTACHSAIRAGQDLTHEAMRDLLRRMRQERLSLTCPHGRPTVVRLSRHELDKQFKRIV